MSGFLLCSQTSGASAYIRGVRLRPVSRSVVALTEEALPGELLPVNTCRLFSMSYRTCLTSSDPQLLQRLTTLLLDVKQSRVVSMVPGRD